MSALTEDLPRKTIQSWRNFAQTPEFRLGIDWLRHNRAPKPGGATEGDMLKSALSWNAYMAALEDIEDVLTRLPKSEPSLEESPMGGDGIESR